MGIAMGALLEAVMLWLLPDSIIQATFIVFVIVVDISYGFELISKFSGWGHYDIYDAIASIIGGIIGMSVIVICQLAWPYEGHLERLSLPATVLGSTEMRIAGVSKDLIMQGAHEEIGNESACPKSDKIDILLT